MLTRRTLLASASSAALLSSLAACGGSDEGSSTGTKLDPNAEATLTMTWWGNDDRAEKYKKSIEAFNKKFPKIKVQTQFQPFGDYWTARNTEAAGGALPDVMQMDLSYLRQFANNNQLLDLGPQLGVNLDTTGFEKLVLEAGKLNDKQYAIATSTNTFAHFYHPGLLQKLGMEPLKEGYTWEDYKQFVLEGAKKGAAMNPKLYSGASPAGVLWFFVQWLLQEGITPFNDDNTLGFDKSHVQKWLDMFTELDADDVKFPPARTEQLKPKGGFTVNEIASEFSWDNFLSGYVADSGDKDIKMLPIPAGKDGKQAMFSKPSMLLAAGANTKHADAAAALISFLVNDPEVGKIFGTSKGVPAVAAQRDAMDVKEGSIDKTVLDYEASVKDMITAKTPVPIEGFGAIEAAWLRLAEDYGYKKITTQQWADQWWTAVEENLPKK